jgi:hypothetical protein
MSCDACGQHGPTKYVEFYQNIGMLVLRTSKNVKGELCKPCINRYFWEFTLITAVAGWWGMISMVLTPIFLLNNIFRFCTTIGMARVAHAAANRLAIAEHPTLCLTADAVARLQPFAAEVRQRLGGGADLEDVAGDVARRAQVSALQAELFAKELGMKHAHASP